jgi:hypothetical protein
MKMKDCEDLKMPALRWVSLSNSPNGPQLLHQTISPATGPAMAIRCPLVIRRGKSPFVVDFISSIAELAGAVLSLLIPTWAKVAAAIQKEEMHN